MKIKNTWQECYDTKIFEIFEEVKLEAKRLYPTAFEKCPELPLFIDNSTSKLGHCNMELAGSGSSKFAKEACIILSKYILNDLRVVRSICVHEVAHFITPTDNHGLKFRIAGQNIGRKWGITVDTHCTKDESKIFRTNITTDRGNTNQPIYTIRCPKCKREWSKTRKIKMIKYPNLYFCTSCKAWLEPVNYDPAKIR